MNFFKHYFTEIYGNWNYKVQDIYTALYDFYAISLINIEQIKDEELAYSLKEAKQINIDYLRDFLIAQLQLATSSELVHYRYFHDAKYMKSNTAPTTLEGGERVQQFFKDYVKEFAKESYDSKRSRLSTDGKDYDTIRDLTSSFMKKYGYTLVDLFVFGKYAFGDNSGWLSDQFGGSAWKTIASAGLSLIDSKHEKNIGKVMAVVDHVIDLEHNSGSVLNKNHTINI
jgi:hypothetical protein